MSQTISLNDAKLLTYAWQRSSFGSSQSISVKVSSADLETLTAQSGCEEVRIYFGLDTNGKLTVVLVGVDVSNNDMTTGTLINHCNLCPPNFPNTDSDLIFK